MDEWGLLLLTSNLFPSFHHDHYHDHHHHHRKKKQVRREVQARFPGKQIPEMPQEMIKAKVHTF